jgi:3-dehydroquinate dehydratase
VLQTTLSAIEDIFQAGQDWQSLSEAFQSFKPGKLSSAKVYKPLKEDYPALRETFDARHKALKEAAKALGTDYFRYTEEETLAMLAECGPTIRRFTDLALDFMAALRRAKQERNVLDFNDLEQKASDPQAKLLILCNPHNPVGRVWTWEELQHVDDICRRHGVIVVSDEIHNELCFQGRRYLPYGVVSGMQNTIVCTSSSKSFNTAGLQIANIICANAQWREKIDRAININEVCDVNPFGVAALQAAYNESEDWLDQLCDYIWQNYETLCRKVLSHAEALGIEAELYQSNHEGDLIDRIQDAAEPLQEGSSNLQVTGIVLNAGGYSHTSVALRDAVEESPVPVVEVHISDITKREPFRRTSLLTDVCAHNIIGHGTKGYAEAVEWILTHNQ